MTSIGIKLDAFVCRQLAKAGIRTPLFGGTTDRQFALCHTCHRIFPHWWGCLTAEEAKRRGFVGCACGGMKLDIAVVPGWKAAWWVLVRGLLVRKLLLRKVRWDPRMPVRDRDLA